MCLSVLSRGRKSSKNPIKNLDLNFGNVKNFELHIEYKNEKKIE